jgi:hypothetical protein
LSGIWYFPPLLEQLAELENTLKSASSTGSSEEAWQEVQQEQSIWPSEESQNHFDSLEDAVVAVFRFWGWSVFEEVVLLLCKN